MRITKAGTPLQAGAPDGSIFLLHFGPASVANQVGVCDGAIHSNRSRGVRQNRVVADVAAIHEVILEQAAHQGILPPLQPGKPDQPVSSKGVRCPCDSVVVNPDARGPGGRGDLGVELLRTFEAAELGTAIVNARQATWRHLGVQSEWPP